MLSSHYSRAERLSFHPVLSDDVIFIIGNGSLSKSLIDNYSDCAGGRRRDANCLMYWGAAHFWHGICRGLFWCCAKHFHGIDSRIGKLKAPTLTLRFIWLEAVDNEHFHHVAWNLKVWLKLKKASKLIPRRFHWVVSSERRNFPLDFVVCM
jgi:hypothetical protein